LSSKELVIDEWLMNIEKYCTKIINYAKLILPLYFIIKNMSNQNLTIKQQYFRIGYLGFSFMIMFTSFFSLQNMVSKLYEDYNYKNLGQVSLLVIYLSFGICTIFSSYVVKRVGYKRSMFFSSLGYVIF
jgi:hypothetical protein